MKRMLKTLLALTASTVLWAGQANAVLIEVNTTIVGTQVTIEVVASDLGDDIIAAYDVDLLYDASVLTFVDGMFDCFLGACTGDSFGIGIVADGLADVFEVSFLSDEMLEALQAGLESILLFTIDFECSLDPDTDECLFGDFSFVWDDFNDVKCADNEVCYPVSVPEPGTLGLLGLGLLGLGLARRRRTL